MSVPATPQASEATVTAAQVLDAPGSSPATTPAVGASDSSPKPDDKVSGKFQAIIQREKKALALERSAKNILNSAEARAKELESREARISEFESLKKTNPMKALEMLGLSYQDLTQIALADGNVTPDLKIKQLEEKLNGFSQAQEADKRAQLEASQKQQEQQHAHTIDKFKVEIGNYLKENANRYELIAFEQSDELVYDVIDEHYNRTLKAAQTKAEEDGEDVSSIRGEIMTIADAADKIEAHLEKKYDKARELKKVQALLAPRIEKALSSVAKPTLTPSRQMPKTLNNNLSATPAAPRKSAVSDDERIARAIAYAKGLRPAL